MSLMRVTLLLGIIQAVGGQDPTTVCFPSVFQTSYFDLITEDKGVVFVDFGKELWSEISSVTGSRFIYDFANLKSYAISGQGNLTDCQSYSLPQSQVLFRCLPPYAKLVAGATGYLPGQMAVQTWDVPTERDSVLRIVFAVVPSYPFWPIMSQQFGYHGITNMYLYTNPSPAVTNQSVFTIPPSCL